MGWKALWAVGTASVKSLKQDTRSVKEIPKAGASEMGGQRHEVGERG